MGVSIQTKHASFTTNLTGPRGEVAALSRESSRFVFVVEGIAPEPEVELWYYARYWLAVDNVVDVAEVDVFPGWWGWLLHWTHGWNVAWLRVRLHRP
jgi:hypothetical protein